MIRIQQIKLNITEDETVLKQKVLKKLKISESEIIHFQIVKKSIDARKKPILFYNYVIEVQVKNENNLKKRIHDPQIIFGEEKKYHFTASGTEQMKYPPAIIGMGPAGLFCAYLLAKNGYNPVLYERGKKVEERKEDVESFWNNGKLLLNSNVSFGEGGAGTFSDGKLNTLVKDKEGRNKEVLRIFVENGAPESILYESKPHIGTDLLIHIIKNMRHKIEEWGGTIYYQTTVTDFILQDNTIHELELNHKETVPVQSVVLAIGHSARDTFETLYHRGIPMEAKSFAVGFRVMHPQSLIDLNQYGKQSDTVKLPPASYKLVAKSKSGRGVYSFCMCPGGFVVNASSEEGRMAVNGMSYHNRDSKIANSAIIVSVTPNDYGTTHPLGGMMFQRSIEERAYQAGNGKIPVSYYKDFKENSKHTTYIDDTFLPCIKGEYQFSDLKGILTKEMNEAFIEGMEQFGKTIKGFCDDFCIMAGVESRTSSPIKIARDETNQSKIKGLYPCGEGAGYAGGITSAAMDGMIIAESIARNYKTS